ncbi:hypothetical protein [Azospirillum sp. sgz301742]
MPRFLLTLPITVLLLAGCNATTSGTGARDTAAQAAREAAVLPAAEANPGFEEWARMAEIGVAFGPAIAPVVFDGLSASDKATLLALSRSTAGREGEFASLSHTAPNGWTFERVFLRAPTERPCALFEFHARRGTSEATGFALGCQVKDALLVYQVGGSDVTSPNIFDSMLSFVPDGRLSKVANYVKADAGRFQTTPPPGDWEELGARRAQWRREFREDAPVMIERTAAAKE